MDVGRCPGFPREAIRELPDGSHHVRNGDGVIVLENPEAGSIPAEIAHLLTNRATWEEHYHARYAWHADRVDRPSVRRSAGDWPVLADTRDFQLFSFPKQVARAASLNWLTFAAFRPMLAQFPAQPIWEKSVI